MYKYKNTKDAYTNDLVMWTNLPEDISNRIPYKVYLVKRKAGSLVEILDENNKLQLYGKFHGFKVLQTKPASQAKVGDYIFRLSEGPEQFPKGEIRKITEVDAKLLWYTSIRSVHHDEVIVIEQAEEDKQEKEKSYPYFIQGVHNDSPLIVRQDRDSYTYLHVTTGTLLGLTFEGTHSGLKPCDFTIEPEIYDLDWYQQRFKSGLPVYAIDSKGDTFLCKGLSPKEWNNTTRFSITDKKIPKQNDKYQYLDRQPEDGDVVERIKCGNLPEESVGNLAIIGQNHFSPNEKEGANPSPDPEWWRVVKTLPGTKAKVGDTCIRIKNSISNNHNGSKVGDVFKVTHLSHFPGDNYTGVNDIGYCLEYVANPSDVRVLCLANKPKAYYKRSGKPWTVEELRQIPDIWRISYEDNSRKFIYASPSNNMYFWGDQLPISNPQNYNIVAFEDEFETTPTELLEEPRLCTLGTPTKESKLYSTFKENKMTFQQLINAIFPDEVQTDYEKKPKFLVIIYNNEGTEIAQTTADSVATVESKIQNTPSLWGCKAICYKEHTEVQTQVPITSIRIK